MYRKCISVICTLLLIMIWQSTFAQTDKPAWTSGYFNDMSRSYLEVKTAMGFDRSNAREKAIEQIMEDRGLSTGTEVKLEVNDHNISLYGSHDLIVKSRIISEYYERVEPGVYKAYLLVQTAKNPTYTFESVKLTDKYPFSMSVFVPGMSQIKKGSNAKGACFIGGEVLFVGGAIVSHCLLNYNLNKMNSTHNSSLRLHYINNANICMTTRNISIAGAVAVYLWNVIDGIAAKGQQHIIYGDALSFYPYSDFFSTGFTLSFKL